jgi:predicted MFS family arabinose efflux permease
LIAVFTGATLGMSKVMLTLFAVNMGASPSQLGAVNSVEGLSIALLTLPAGVLVARLGSRPVYVVASAIAAVFYLLLPKSTSWIELALCVGLCSMCSAFRIVAMSGAFMDLLPALGAGKAGWFRGAVMTGLVLVGPLSGTLLVQRFGTAGAYAFVSGGFLVMALAGPLVLPRARHPERDQAVTQSLARFIGLLRHPIVARVCALDLAMAMILSYFASFIVLIGMKEFGLRPPVAALLVIVEGSTSVLTMFLGGLLLRDFGFRQMFALNAGFLLAGLATLSAARSARILAVGAMLLAVGLAIAHLLTVRRLSMLDVNKGSAASLQIMAQTVGLFLGTLLGGALADWLTTQAVFACAAVVYAMAAGVAAKLPFRQPADTSAVPASVHTSDETPVRPGP